MGKLSELELLKMEFETKKREFDYYKMMVDLKGYNNLCYSDKCKLENSIEKLNTLNFKIRQQQVKYN